MSWAWKQDLDPTDKFVLVALADHANDEDFTCWPSLSHLQKKTGYSRPTIWKAIDRLVKHGAVKRVGESAAESTVYRVEVGNELTQVTKLPKVGNHVNKVGNQGNKVGNHVTPNHQEPSGTITEPSSVAGLDPVAWDKWVQYRKSIRKPLKQASIPAAQRKLAAFGSDQPEVVEQSIANSWQGLFPVRRVSNGRKTFADYHDGGINGSSRTIDSTAEPVE